MEINDTLFQLIKSLSAEERTGFIRSLTVYEVKSKQNQHVVLFHAMSKLKGFNYSDLVASVSDKIPKATLSPLKTQLKNKLLDYLRHNDSKERRWHELLEESMVLYQRGLYAEASKTLIKVKTEASEAFKHHYVLAALKLEGLIIQRTREHDIFDATKQHGKNLIQIARHQLQAVQIYDLYTSLVAVTFKGSLVRDEKILADLYALEQSEAFNYNLDEIPVDQKQFLLLARYNLYKLISNFSAAYTCTKYSLSLLQSDMNYFMLHKQNIPAMYMNHMDMCLLTGQKDEWETTLELYGKFVGEHYPEQTFYDAFYVQQKYSYDLLHPTQNNTMQLCISNLEQYYHNQPLPVLLKKLFELSLLWAYYRVKDYSRALDYGRMLTEENHSDQMAGEMNDVVRFIVLAIRFEQFITLKRENRELVALTSFVTSEYEFFRKKKTDYRLELALTRLIRQALKSETDRSVIALVEDFQKQNQKWITEKVAYIRSINQSFNLNDWCLKQLTILKKR